MGKLLHGKFGQPRTNLHELLSHSSKYDPEEVVGEAPSYLTLPTALPADREVFSQALAQRDDFFRGRSAAWVVWRMRKKFHEQGFIKVHLLKGDVMGKGFKMALRALKVRPTRWKVDSWTDVKGTFHARITWLRWRMHGGH